MRSAVLCHAAQDVARAHGLGAYLALNCPLEVFQDEGCMREDESFLETVGRALSANLVLVLLSPDSVPKLWRRDEWEPALLDQPREYGSEIVFLLVRDCKFPELLRRRAFFDLTKDCLEGQRALKRWFMSKAWIARVVDLPAESVGARGDRDLLDGLERRLADQPGTESDVTRDVALAFAHQRKDEFEGVFWLNCASRSAAGILGDTAHHLGLRLAGTLEENRRGLEELCAHRRCLFVFEHVAPEDRDLVAFEGKASVIFTAPGAMPGRRSLADTAALFSSWTQNPEACLSALGDAQTHLREWQFFPDDAAGQMRATLGSAMLALLKHRGRLAEACELLEMMISAMHAKNDPLAACRLEWEKSWILEGWGQPVGPAARLALGSQPEQLTLGFTAGA